MYTEIPLDKVAAWPKDYIQKLSQLGVTTAEQVVSKASIPGGLSAIARHLGAPEGRVQQLVDSARSHLLPDVARMMAAKVNTETMALGALPLDDVEKKGKG